MLADDFLNTLGVNTHVNYPPYDNTGRIISALDYIGFTNIRQSSPIDQGSASGIFALGAAGLKIDLIVNGGGPVNLAGAMQDVYNLAPFLNAVENVNEVAIYPIRYAGLSGVDAAVVLQRDLYAAVRSTPSLDNVPVYSFTIGGADPSAYPSIGDISAYTDYANIHSYPPDGLRPIFVIHAAIDGGRTDAPSKPVVVTETGYYTLMNHVGWGGVPESVQASYLLGEVLDEAAAGVARTYLYDLLDDGADPGGTNMEAHFGLFHVDGSPKLAATAFHNLTTILKDPAAAGASPAASDFSFTASGVPYDYTGNTLQLDKSDGSHVIAVWNEEQLWDTDKLTWLPAQHFPVTVDLHQSYQTVLVFDPTVGTAPVQALHDTATVQLDLTDHPFLIEVLPNVAAVAAAVPVAAASPAEAAAPAVASPVPEAAMPAAVPGASEVASGASGVDVVVAHISEDAYLGDALFRFTADGVPFGDVQTARALHSAGQTQDFTLRGLPGLHASTLGVTFLNDAYDGTPSTDRNLYVDGVTVNGVDQPDAARTLLSAGPTSIGIGDPQPTEVSFGLSEDAWQGDAIASVSIDGRQLGDVVTITALHVSGDDQRLSFQVALDAGPHVATVTFLNDAYAGTPDTDRNLYVDMIGIGGSTVAGSSATMYSAGSQSFTIPPRGNGADLFSVDAGSVYPSVSAS